MGKTLYMLSPAISLLLGAVVVGSPLSGVARKTGSTRSAAQLYASKCASCHGKDGRAKTFKAKFNHARNISDRAWQENISDERIFNSIMNGKRKMPAFGKKLSDQEIESLVTYVRGLKK